MNESLKLGGWEHGKTSHRSSMALLATTTTATTAITAALEREKRGSSVIVVQYLAGMIQLPPVALLPPSSVRLTGQASKQASNQAKES